MHGNYDTSYVFKRTRHVFKRMSFVAQCGNLSHVFKHTKDMCLNALFCSTLPRLNSRIMRQKQVFKCSVFQHNAPSPTARAPEKWGTMSRIMPKKSTDLKLQL